MENIKFLDLIKKSYDIINGDRKRFGILFGIGTILSFLVVKDRINPISTTVYLILTFGFFIAISAVVIRIVKEVYENNEYLDDNYLLRFLEKRFISALKVQLIHVMFIILVLILSSIPIAILIAFVGSALTRFMPLFYTVAVGIIAIPVIALNIMIGNAVQFNLLNENSIVDSFKNSIFLGKIDRRMSVIATLKLYIAYYGIMFLAISISKWVSPISAIIISADFIMFSIVSTLIYYELIKGNEELFDENNKELWEEN